MLVSLPSKIGEVSGLAAHRPQSQYLCTVSHWLRRRDDDNSYGLSSIVSTFFDQSLFVGKREVPMPGEEVALSMVSSVSRHRQHGDHTVP